MTQLRPRHIDPYYIPAAPGGFLPPDCPDPLLRSVFTPGAYFCFLNARDQRRFALALMHVPGRRGYKLVQGRTVEDTRAIALALGLTEAHVDERTNRIGWGNVDILAWLSREEYEARIAERAESARARQMAFKDEHPARIDEMKLRGVRGVVMQIGEYEERAAHARREDRPVVGYTGPVPSSPSVATPSTPPAPAGPLPTYGPLTSGRQEG